MVILILNLEAIGENGGIVFLKYIAEDSCSNSGIILKARACFSHENNGSW